MMKDISTATIGFSDLENQTNADLSLSATTSTQSENPMKPTLRLPKNVHHASVSGIAFHPRK
jgi:hypothetical protein